MSGIVFSKRLVYLLSLFCTLTLVFLSLKPINGLVGHDYAHYYPRILLGASHFWKNGWSVPHFTPSLCGGVPYFADPQSYYYSLPQFLSFFISPWVATYFSYFVFYLLGYWGMLRLSSLYCQKTESIHISAIAFLLNGFSYAHLMVGHANHYQFLLIPGLVYLFLMFFKSGPSSSLNRIILFSLAVIYCIYSGALHILAVLIATLLIFGVHRFASLKRGELSNIVCNLLWLIPILILSCAGKWLAVQRYTPQFHLHGIDRSTLSPVYLWLQYLWFDPSHLPVYIPFGNWLFGPWEFVGFVSKITLFGVLYYCLKLLPAQLTLRWKATLGIVLASLTVIFIASGVAFNEVIPVLKHYHNPLKLLGAFIVPLCVLWGVVFESIFKSNWIQSQNAIWKGASYLLLLALMFTEYQLNTVPFKLHPSILGYHYDSKVYHELKRRGGAPPVTELEFRGRDSELAIRQGASLINCYEPLFGYRLEGLGAKLFPGSVYQNYQGGYNLTHPACLLYGKELNCKAWDRIPTSEKDNLEKFIHGETPTNWVPWWQRLIDNIDAVFVNLLIVVALGNSLREYLGALTLRRVTQ